MSLTEYPDVEQGSEEWHDQRRGIVTASVVGRLITTKTMKPADNDYSRGLTAQMVAERITQETEPTYTSDDMMRGILHEPIARDRYAEHNNVEVTQVGFGVRTLHSGHRLGASPDGLIGDDGGLEIKCPRAKTHIRTIIADEVPPQYMAQVQANLLVFGRSWWDFVSFCAGQPMFTKRVYPDPAWHSAIYEALAAFEASAEEMASTYLARCIGLPETERIELDELVI